MSRTVVALLLGLLLAAGAWAQHFEQGIETTFPATIGPFEYRGREAYPKSELGAVLRYLKPGQIVASVFVYDFGLSSIPSELTDQRVSQQFLQAVGDINAQVSSGRAKAVRGLDEAPRLFAPQPCGKALLRTDFEIDFSDQTSSSYLLLTTLKNHFVKVRITHLKASPEARESVEDFVQGLSAVLGKCS